MSANTKIQWCDATINFWWGCTKVSPGCANCYADTLSHRWGKDIWGKGKPREDHRKGATALARRLNKQTGIDQKETREWNEYYHNKPPLPIRRPRVFCQSMSDWLDDEVPIEWLADLLATIHATPNLDWLLLTKRPENWRKRISRACDTAEYTGRKNLRDWIEDWFRGSPPPHNVWIGASVEDQQRADERIPKLLEIPAKVRFLSVEPMLGPVDFGAAYPCGYYCDPPLPELAGDEPAHYLEGHHDHPFWSPGIQSEIHWVIFGGESGPGARPCNIEWIRDGLRQCKAAGVAAFCKQLGSRPFLDGQPYRVKDRKGGDITEFPSDLQIREFPEGKGRLSLT